MRQYRIYYNLLDWIPFLNLEIDEVLVESNIIRSKEEANRLIVYYGVLKNRPDIWDVELQQKDLTDIISYIDKNVSRKELTK